ncbi:MAG: lipoprotein-anchoring transpeptidase ErfK/SrfK [Verrucomicrobiales bacterium]|jgi:lipoprotein-anchoring transpeptidase ErfK/SrfK
MPLLPKVKTRIIQLSLAAVAMACIGLLVANNGPKKPEIGELAVSPPKQPILAPSILAKAIPRNTQLRINLVAQRLYLLVDNEVAIDTPIASGRKDRETPTGKFVVGKKELSRKQDDYGNFVDAKGKVIVAGIYSTRDPIPSGLRFQAVALDHVMEFKDQTFAIHGGASSSLPTSTGAIIVPAEIAKMLYANVSTGCPVEISGE